MKNIVLVDFTEASINTLKYAASFVNSIEGSLIIVNVSNSNETTNVLSELKLLQSKYSKPGFDIQVHALKGELIPALSDYINNDKIGFVFAGTHDMKLIERLFSSRALKLLNEIHANFIFIPNSFHQYKPINHVLVPIFPDKHSIQNLEVLIFWQHFKKFEVTLCTYKSTDPEKGKTLYVATKILAKAGIPFSIKYLGETEKQFMDKLVPFAFKIGVDTLSIVNLTESNLFNFAAKGFTESLIHNDFAMPVIAIQNKQLATYSSFHTAGGY